ncbi:MAG: alpha/beta fold hydrolase [Desulfuromonadales bacterium]|nr:alpha/beta fold hydrolase [Desulfuromonadales bacterium]
MKRQNPPIDCSETHSGCQNLRRDSQSQGVVDQDNLPFMLCPPGAKTAVLLVHGFTATPWEMRPLAEFLAESGIASLAVRLPGHGTSPEDLAGCRWEEWSDAILDGYQILSKDFQAIYGMGMSTGCLLLLTMAQAKQFKGLVLFSPYLRVLHRLAPYAGWLKWIRPYQVKPADAELNECYYNRRPLAGIHQINRLLKTVRSQLPRVVCPVLAFNGEGDQTVDIDSGRQLMDLLGSSFKIYARYGPEVPHVLTQEENPYCGAMFAQATNFVQELEAPGSTVRVR